jgi:hypothetical protein
MRWRVLLVVVVLALAGCGAGKHDNADSVAGPGVSVHCAGLEPGRGNGDTTVRVTCGTSNEGQVQVVSGWEARRAE